MVAFKQRYLARSDAPDHEEYGKVQSLVKVVQADAMKFVKQLVKDWNLNPEVADGYKSMAHGKERFQAPVYGVLTPHEYECNVDIMFDNNTGLRMRFYFQIEDNRDYKDALILTNGSARYQKRNPSGYVVDEGYAAMITPPMTYGNIYNVLIKIPDIKEYMPHAIKDESYR